MLDFQFYNPTRVYFGKKCWENAGKVASQYGRKAMLMTGQGSVKSTGIYAKIVKLLNADKVEIVDFEGIHSNPRLSECEKAIKICKEVNIDMIIALGGGSVNDAAKTIAAGALDEGDVWDYYTGRRTIKKALPLITIITVAATGSENNSIAVLKHDQLNKKFGVMNEHLFPKATFIDPELTYTVSAKQTTYGAIDMITHVLEYYIDGPDNPLLQIRFVEALIKTVMESTERVLSNPRDYEARCYLSWASAIACSGLFLAGTGGGVFMAHQIETELGGIYDTAHGAGLSITMPAVMRYFVEQGRYIHSHARFAEKVMQVERQGKMLDADIALEGIEAFRRWIKKIGNPTTLRDLGIAKQALESAAERIASNPNSPADKETAVTILRMYAD